MLRPWQVLISGDVNSAERCWGPPSFEIVMRWELDTNVVSIDKSVGEYYHASVVRREFNTNVVSINRSVSEYYHASINKIF